MHNILCSTAMHWHKMICGHIIIHPRPQMRSDLEWSLQKHLRQANIRVNCSLSRSTTCGQITQDEFIPGVNGTSAAPQKNTILTNLLWRSKWIPKVPTRWPFLSCHRGCLCHSPSVLEGNPAPGWLPWTTSTDFLQEKSRGKKDEGMLSCREKERRRQRLSTVNRLLQYIHRDFPHQWQNVTDVCLFS